MAQVSRLQTYPSIVYKRLNSELISQYWEFAYRFAFFLSGSSQNACELTEAAYGEVSKSCLRLLSVGKILLFRSLYRRFLRTQNSFAAEIPKITPVSGEVRDSCSGARDWDDAAIFRAVSELKIGYRAPTVLFYLGAFSLEEIAAILGITRPVVISQLSAGKDMLRNIAAGAMTSTCAEEGSNDLVSKSKK